jgi:hypothetical protein
MQETQEPEPEPTIEPPKEEPKEPVADAAPASAPIDAPVTETPPAEEMVTIKVDGEEKQVPKKLVDEHGGVRSFQMEIAAAKRLQEAAEAKRLANEERQQLLREREQLRQPPPQPDVSEADLLNIVRMSDDPAQVKVALARLANVQQQPSIDQTLSLVHAHLDAREAQHWFENEYKDIVADPIMQQLATQAVKEARSRGDQRPHQELLAFVGSSLREWRKRMAPQTTTQVQAAPMDAKRDAKAATVNVPSAKTRQVLPDEPRPLTREEKIAEMRSARGLN